MEIPLSIFCHPITRPHFDHRSTVQNASTFLISDQWLRKEQKGGSGNIENYFMESWKPTFLFPPSREIGCSKSFCADQWLEGSEKAELKKSKLSIMREEILISTLCSPQLNLRSNGWESFYLRSTVRKRATCTWDK